MFISCNCSIDYDGEDYTIEEFVIRTARKPHECGECDRAIEPGERYESFTGLINGGWEHHKTCLGCLRIRQHLSPDGWIWGGLAEQVEECVGFNYVTGEEVCSV